MGGVAGTAMFPEMIWAAASMSARCNCGHIGSDSASAARVSAIGNDPFARPRLAKAGCK